MSLPPPLVRLCRVRVDADGSVAVPDGCVGFLHLDEDTGTKERKLERERKTLNDEVSGVSSPCPLGVQDGEAGVQFDGFGEEIQSFLQVAWREEKPGFEIINRILSTLLFIFVM